MCWRYPTIYTDILHLLNHRENGTSQSLRLIAVQRLLTTRYVLKVFICVFYVKNNAPAIKPKAIIKHHSNSIRFSSFIID